MDFTRMHVIPAPVPMTIRVREGGVYHGESVFAGKRQEPDTFRREPIAALGYRTMDMGAAGQYADESPSWVMLGSGRWVTLGHWYDDLRTEGDKR